MSEQTALILARLSHQWFPIVFASTITIMLASWLAGWILRKAGATSALRRIAIAARCVLSAMLGVSVAVFVIAFFHVGCSYTAAHKSQCQSNVKRLSMGMLMYSHDFDEHFPVSARWTDLIAPELRKDSSYVKSADGDPFGCPAAQTPASYGMNAALSRTSLATISAPSETVLLFEADGPIRSFSGGANNVAWSRHLEAPNFAYADGHVKHATVYTVKRLIWELSK